MFEDKNDERTKPIIITPDNANFLPGIRYSEIVKELCIDFFEKMSINYFSITRTYPDGSCCDLSSDGKWMKNYIEKGHSIANVENFFSFSESKNNFFLWQINNIFNSNETLGNLYTDCCEFKYTNGVTLVQAYSEYQENYHFCSSKQNTNSESFLLENIHLLEKFVFYIKEKIFSHKDIKSAFLTRFLLDSDNKHHSKKSIVNDKLDLDINVSKFYLNDSQYLTLREMEVLQCVIRNRSSKEIARLLNISPRTVETFVEKIKFKTSCETIRDLTKYVLNNRMLFNQLIAEL